MGEILCSVVWCGAVCNKRDRARERVTERECVSVIEGECGRVRKGTHTQHTHKQSIIHKH